jgi:hypothetical protein
MTDEEIIQTAHLMHAVDRGEGDEDALKRALDTMDRSDQSAMALAGKLIEGLPYRITTDNPDTVARARTIARLVGGTVSSFEENGHMTSVVFVPSATHRLSVYRN